MAVLRCVRLCGVFGMFVPRFYCICFVGLCLFHSVATLGCVCSTALPRWAVSVPQRCHVGLCLFHSVATLGCVCSTALLCWAVSVPQRCFVGLCLFHSVALLGCVSSTALPRWAVSVPQRCYAGLCLFHRANVWFFSVKFQEIITCTAFSPPPSPLPFTPADR